jgi:hypothetical protein
MMRSDSFDFGFAHPSELGKLFPVFNPFFWVYMPVDAVACG